MYRALWSWIVCVMVTVVVSLMTKPKPDSELVGLVYGCTESRREGHLPLYQRPVFWAAVVAVVFCAEHHLLVKAPSGTSACRWWLCSGLAATAYSGIE